MGTKEKLAMIRDIGLTRNLGGPGSVSEVAILSQP
jgi:hypothetical protein